MLVPPYALAQYRAQYRSIREIGDLEEFLDRPPPCALAAPYAISVPDFAYRTCTIRYAPTVTWPLSALACAQASYLTSALQCAWLSEDRLLYAVSPPAVSYEDMDTGVRKAPLLSPIPYPCPFPYPGCPHRAPPPVSQSRLR
eukprot:1478373-Rhodomonas_salina.1